MDDQDHPPHPRDAFWEDAETVERFARRDPDVRMVARFAERPVRTKVLDLGCAGGRNTAWLASRGFDVVALDASRAMVARTRERLAALLGPGAARQRVHQGVMSDLSRFDDGAFDVVLALGVFHTAATDSAWQAALAETARVLRAGGEGIVSQFGPDAAPRGERPQRVPGTQHVYTGFFDRGVLVLVDADELDAALGALGLVPLSPTTTVRVETELGYRTSVNGLFRRDRVVEIPPLA